MPGGILAGMSEQDQKRILHHYLQIARESVLWKLDGLSEYDIRRPLVPTGTNLLGLVKHLARVDAGYFGESFGRPFGEAAWPWDEQSFNPDLWATAEESREQIVELYRRVWAHSDATIEALPLDAPGRVAWWPAGKQETTLQRVLVHMLAETNRHAGHADLVRELIDGEVGLTAGNENMDQGDAARWAEYRDRLEQVARQAQTA